MKHQIKSKRGVPRVGTIRWHGIDLEPRGCLLGHKQKHGEYSGGEGDEEHNDVSIQSK